MKTFLSQSTHQKIYLFGLICLSIGMIYSGPVASMSIMLLGANWISELNFRQRIDQFLHNKTALILSAVFFLHALGLLWTKDYSYGWDDVRTKIPLFVLPFILSTSPTLSKQSFSIFLGVFISAIVVSTLISTFILLGFSSMVIQDIRNISIFISHIRLSLMICLAIFILAYFLVNNPSLRMRIIYAGVIIWLLVFMALLESLTGLIIFSMIALILGIYYFKSRKPMLGKFILAVVSLLILASGIHIYIITRSFRDLKPVEAATLSKVTINGNNYENLLDFPVAENGTYVYLQVCWQELRSEWNKKATVPFDARDSKGNSVSQTLVRYMASLGMLKKDSVTFAHLSTEDIRCIENGVTNYKYKNLGSLNARIYETIWEIDVYRKGSNTSGHSVTMRFEFWRAGWHILKKHFLTGVGTGDVKQAFANQYKTDQTQLDARWQLRAHNQYLTVAIALGLPGLALFLLSLIYPMWKGGMYRNYFCVVFWMICIFSMLTEDTLETQAGVTFYALFNSVFLFASPDGLRSSRDVSEGINGETVYPS